MFADLRKFVAALGKNMGRTWVLALLVVAGGLAAGAIIGRTGRQPEDRLAYSFKPGQRWRHQFRFAGTGSMDLTALTGGQNAAVSGQQAQSIHTIVEGELVTDILEKDDRKVLLACSLPKSKVVLLVGDIPLIDGTATIETDLVLPVFVEVDLQGRIQSVRFSPQVRDLSRNCLRSLLAAMQVALPADNDATDVWEAWEQSPQGRCRAVYQVDPDAPVGINGLIKTREEYEQPTAKKTDVTLQPAVSYHPAGALRIAFDRELGLVHSINGSESLVMKIQDRVLSTSQNSIAFVFVKRETIPTSELNQLVALAKERAKVEVAEPLSAKSSNRGDGLLSQKQQLGDATFESLQADLAREETNAQQNNDQTPLYLKIKALIAVQPETSSRWAALVNKATPESLTMRMVPAALAAVGNEQSQAALVAIVKARDNDEVVLQRLLAILAQVKTPSPLAENTMRDLAVRSQQPSIALLAQLSLGNMARNLHDKSPARAEKIVAWAISEMEASPSESKTVHWLLVLGNTGAAEALPVIRTRLGDSASGVRAAAASALRFIEGDQAEAMLLQTLKADPDAAVRCAAIAAFRYRPMSKEAFGDNRDAMRSDKSVEVRLAALNLLWEARQRFPEVISLVEAVAANDQIREIREAAGRLLASVRG
jgi:HEAT repeat protein